MYALYIDDTGYARAHYTTCYKFIHRKADVSPTGSWTSDYKTVADAHKYASQNGITTRLRCRICGS